MLRHALLAAVALTAAAFAGDAKLAPTPPMGWNSWDAYGFTLTEAEYKANAEVLAQQLKDAGWTYAIVDMGWYMAKPLGEKTADQDHQIDAYGRVIPAVNLFPSAANGAGFKPLADWAHAKGLKFGIHIMRGIPKEAVAKNMPIEGSNARADEAANTADTCSWNDGYYGVKDNAAGQAYYDSALKLYASWNVDYIKIDCIADHPYKPDEIRMVSEAIKKTGRDIVLSLSPGPTNISRALEVGQRAQLWRISDDNWDAWTFKPGANWPNGLREAFDYLGQWYPYAKPGTWPDADMLPFGSLTPHPGWGEPRQSRLTPDETRSWFTLWAIARSPLMLGANLTKMDEPLKALVTNKDLIAVNQTAWESHPVDGLKQADARVWVALTGPRGKPVATVAAFNLSDKPMTVTATWKELGVKGAALVDLFTGKKKPAGNGVNVSLPAHGSAIYRVE
jgi:Alpha-galactosidase